MRGLFALVLLGFSAQAFGSGYFEYLRTDLTVPNNCQSVSLDLFDPKAKVDVLTYSTKGAKKKGFTGEVLISRREAGFLFKVFKNSLHKSQKAMRRVRSNPELLKAYQDIIAGEPKLDIKYKVEGEILEALVLSRLIDSLPNTQFVTGGIIYKENSRSRVLGEIDVWIADRSTCQVTSIGEVKLNPRLMGKARKQLKRFRRYVTRWQRQKYGDSTEFGPPRRPSFLGLPVSGDFDWDLLNRAFLLN